MSEENAQSVYVSMVKKLMFHLLLDIIIKKDRFLSLTPFAMKVYRGYDNNEDIYPFIVGLKKSRNNVLYILSKILYGYKKRYIGLKLMSHC